MDPNLSPFINIDCQCGFFRKTGMGAILPVWHVMKNDRRVPALPKDSILRHDCEKLAVGIEKRGISHYYIVRDESAIQK